MRGNPLVLAVCLLALIALPPVTAADPHTLWRSFETGLLEFNYAVRNFKERSYDQIPYTGLSADNVYRETKRALEGGRNAYVDLSGHRYRRLH